MSTVVHLSPKSKNAKTGPIPVSTTSSNTCPDACPLKAANICYAKHGHSRMHWNQVDAGKRGTDWDTFCDKIADLPDGQLWRHNQSGDLPGDGDTIDTNDMRKLVAANLGRRGFTYTHKPMDNQDNLDAVSNANAQGFTINLSADDLPDADNLADLGIAPVVTVLPASQVTNTVTPKGRRVVICPAVTRDNVTCATCGLCQRVNRSTIIGFPAHGAGKNKLS